MLPEQIRVNLSNLLNIYKYKTRNQFWDNRKVTIQFVRSIGPNQNQARPIRKTYIRGVISFIRMGGIFQRFHLFWWLEFKEGSQHKVILLYFNRTYQLHTKTWNMTIFTKKDARCLSVSVCSDNPRRRNGSPPLQLFFRSF